MKVRDTKAPRALSTTMARDLDDWNRRSDKTVGLVSGALAYGFRHMKPSVHTNMIKLVKGGWLRFCRVHAPPPPGSAAASSSPFGDGYYVVRGACPGELPDGALAAPRRRRR